MIIIENMNICLDLFFIVETYQELDIISKLILSKTDYKLAFLIRRMILVIYLKVRCIFNCTGIFKSLFIYTL